MHGTLPNGHPPCRTARHRAVQRHGAGRATHLRRDVGHHPQRREPQARFTWVPTHFLDAQGVAPWSDLPAWLPSDGEDAGMARADLVRALNVGLTFRPLAETVRDTLTWFDALPAERKASLRAGLARERQTDVLAAWNRQLA